jgi:hypothetical protein
MLGVTQKIGKPGYNNAINADLPTARLNKDERII